MRKRGFTLIELLAVIIILAIIALIATPIIMRVIENSKKAAAERSAENYVRAVETQVLALKANGTALEDGIYEIKSNGNLCIDKTTTCTEADEIKINMNGNKPDSGRIKVKDEKIVGYMVMIDNYKNTYGDYAILPPEYQEVEWIGSTGTQYIDTGYSYNMDDILEVGLSLTDCSGDKSVLGAYSNKAALIEVGIWGGKIRFNIDSNLGKFKVDCKENIKYDFIYQMGRWKYGDIYDGPEFNTSVSKNIYVFRRNFSDYKASKSRIYYLKAYRDMAAIIDFVPCYLKLDGTIGMYDLVSGEFYTNQGTGTFEKGDDI